MQSGKKGWSRRAVMRMLGAAAGGAAWFPLTSQADSGKAFDWDSVIPCRAPVKPRKARRLLVFGLNVIYPGHPSIPTANEAFTLMGKKTGAFETVISYDPAVFRKESLSTFDAVFLNNTVGNLFTDPELRKNLLEFVTAGGGLMGVHGTTGAFMRFQTPRGGWPLIEDWPEFGILFGGRDTVHRTKTEQPFLHVEEPDHPVIASLGSSGFVMPPSEYFRAQRTYSRMRDRVLAVIDVEKSGLQNEPHDQAFRQDRDYAQCWVRQYGRGRIFYTAFGHNDIIFRDPRLLRLYLAGTQFVLGDLDAPTIPSAKLTPAIRAQEKLHWKFGLEAYTLHKKTFFDTVDVANGMGMAFVGGLDFQKVSKEIPKNFTPDLSDDELRAIRMKLDTAGMRILTYFTCWKLTTKEQCQKLFDFGRKMGIECFIGEPDLNALPMIDTFCLETGIRFGLHNHDRKQSPGTWSPDAILRICDSGRSPLIGAAPDIGFWIREGIDPIKAIETLRNRIITFQMHDLNSLSPSGKEVPWGAGAFDMEAFLRKVRDLGIRPVMFGLEYSDKFENNGKEIRQSANYFNACSIKIQGGK